MPAFSLSEWEAALLGADPVARADELIDAIPNDGPVNLSAAELRASTRACLTIVSGVSPET